MTTSYPWLPGIFNQFVYLGFSEEPCVEEADHFIRLYVSRKSETIEFPKVKRKAIYDVWQVIAAQS